MKKILVVDDDDSILFLISEILSVVEGVEVLTCGDSILAKQGIEKGGGIDILISDINMPQLTGYDLARAAKANNESAVVILMSGIYDPDKIKKSKADFFIKKPFPYKEFLEEIRKFI